jgi:hypothetical protein
MRESEPNTLNWRTARRSATNGECVEVAAVPERIVVRDSKFPEGVVLRYDVLDWRKFIKKAKKADYKVANPEVLPARCFFTRQHPCRALCLPLDVHA